MDSQPIVTKERGEANPPPTDQLANMGNIDPLYQYLLPIHRNGMLDPYPLLLLTEVEGMLIIGRVRIIWYMLVATIQTIGIKEDLTTWIHTTIKAL